MSADPLNAALLQLAAHEERLAVLEDREAAHFAAISDRIAELASMVARGLGGALAEDQAAVLARLEALDEPGRRPRRPPAQARPRRRRR